MDWLVEKGYMTTPMVWIRADKKSRKELYMQLIQKGISADVLDYIFEECYDDNSSKEAIYSLLQKKRYNPETTSREETQKILAFLTLKPNKEVLLCQVESLLL